MKNHSKLCSFNETQVNMLFSYSALPCLFFKPRGEGFFLGTRMYYGLFIYCGIINTILITFVLVFSIIPQLVQTRQDKEMRMAFQPASCEKSFRLVDYHL